MKRLLLIYCLLFLSAFVVVLKAQTGSPSDTVILNYVSVINDSGDVKLNWTYYMEEDTIEGFILNYKRHLGTDLESNEPFGFAHPDSTNYIDTSGEANQDPVPYSVYAFNYDIDSTSSDTIHRVSLSDTHITIFLEGDLEGCSDTINLNWSKYVGWGDDIIYYRIYENDLLIDSTPDTFYRVRTMINSNYKYVVEAFNTSNTYKKFSSRSNIVSQSTPFPEPPDFINADYATVEGESILLSFTLGPNGRSGYSYILVAKPPSESTFSMILDTLDFTDSNIIYNYLVPNITEQYQFQIIAQDTCGNIRTESNISSNIVLAGELNENTVNLDWTEYVNWSGGVESYTLYRDMGNGFEEIPGASGLSSQDDIRSFIDDGQIKSISYYIEAREEGSDYYSRSNIVVIYLETKIKFPTAFTPDNNGINDVFRPLDLYFVPADYHLIIFDRWGKKVFETKQAEEGWDGKFNSGKSVSEGVYHYYIKYKDAEGIETSQTGIVTVIYP